MQKIVPEQKLLIMRYSTIAVSILVASVLPFIAFASTNDGYDLQHYIEIRRSKFDAYSQSMEKRSGIFGNKTKKDLQKSHDALADIVETDNRIISFLNQKIDVKKYEKVNSNYDFHEQNERIRNLQLATDTLVKQVDLLTASNVTLKNKAQFLKWSVYILSVIVLWMFIQKWKRKIRSNSA